MRAAAFVLAFERVDGNQVRVIGTIGNKDWRTWETGDRKPATRFWTRVEMPSLLLKRAVMPSGFFRAVLNLALSVMLSVPSLPAVIPISARAAGPPEAALPMRPPFIALC